MLDHSPIDSESLVFKQELSEVLLLIDFISGRTDKHLTELDNKIDDPDDTSQKLLLPEILKRLSFIRYPPAPAIDKKASDAAFLWSLKDHLNSLAHPARGITIAYTVMIVQENHHNGTASRFFSKKRRRLLENSQSGMQLPAVIPPQLLSSVEIPWISDRVQAAFDAFPSLIRSARTFRRLQDWLTWGALVFTLTSAVFLWQATYGVQLAAQFGEAKRQEAEAATAIYSQLDKERQVGQQWLEPTDLPKFCNIKQPLDQAPPASDGTSKIRDYAEAKAYAAMFAAKTATIIGLCNDYAFKHALLGTTINTIHQYRQSIFFVLSAWFIPPDTSKSDDRTTAELMRDTTNSAKGALQIAPASAASVQDNKPKAVQEDAQSLSLALAIMTNYIAPLLFGIAGTMAALVRSFREKLRQSLLSPRDRNLALSQLILGLVAGATVGLFFDPSTVSQSGNFAPHPVSASTVAFLAGYGAEGFFRMLDIAISRVFNTDSATKQVH